MVEIGSLKTELLNSKIISNSSQEVKNWSLCCIAELFRIYVDSMPFTNTQLKVNNSKLRK